MGELNPSLRISSGPHCCSPAAVPGDPLPFVDRVSCNGVDHARQARGAGG
jgi:hypothetical protein